MNRGRQIVRQWRILRILEGARRGLGAEEIRGALEDACTIRTVYRDLRQLQEVGFSVIDEDGRWRLPRTGDGGWAVPVEPSQVLSLILSESLLAPLEGSPLAQPLAELRQRLSSMLTPQARAWCHELERTVVATLFAPAEYAEQADHIELLQEAINTEHRVQVSYRSRSSGVRDRLLDPYMFWYDTGRLYLVAWCHKNNAIRTFSIKRFQSVQVTDVTFEVDPDFDPSRFTQRGFGVFHGEVREIVLRVDEELVYLFRERRFHRSQELEMCDGGATVRFRMAGLEEIAAWLAGFGGRVCPIEPPELVERVRWVHSQGLQALATAEVVTSAVIPPR